MRDLICPKCGNADPDRMRLLTDAIIEDGRITGHVLTGWQCEDCTMIIGAGESADALTSGAG